MYYLKTCQESPYDSKLKYEVQLADTPAFPFYKNSGNWGLLLYDFRTLKNDK